MKKAIIFLISFCTILSCLLPLSASAVYNSSVKTEAGTFYLASLDTGAVLFEKDSTKQTAPASLTKIVTATLALQNCQDLSTVVTVKEECIRMLDNTDSSMAGLKAGEEITMKDLLCCLLVSSANEAATIIADYIGGGSIEKFVGMMNDLAAELGCTNTHFVNPHGLDEEGHYSCARDMALLAKNALQYPIFTEITSMTEYTLPATNLHKARKIHTTNFMMCSGYKEYYLPEAKGVKTGSTSNAGKCVITTAAKDGYSYICVVMNAPFYDYDKDGYNENFAFMDAKAMLKWTFENIKLKTVADTSQIISVVKVNYASGVDHLRLVPAEDCVALVPVGVEAGSVLVEPIADTVPESMDAPVKKGDPVCEAVVSYAGEEIARIKLVAAEDISLNVFLLILGRAKAVMSTTAFKVFAVVLLAVVVFLICINIFINKNKKKRRIKIVNYRDLNK